MRFFTQFCFVTFVFILIVVRSQAQSSSPSTAPYLLFKIGYGFPDSQQQIGAYADVPISGGRYKGIYGSYAQGTNVSLGIGKMLNPTFGFEGNAQIMLGKTITGIYDYSTISGSASERARSLILKPMIVIRNSGDLLTIYTKLGLAIAVVSGLYKRDEFTNTENGTHYLRESSETAPVKIGFAAGFGLSFRVTQSFSLQVEVNGQLLSLPIRKGHVIKYEENGIDKLSSLAVSDRSWIYENNIPALSSPNNTEPDVRLFNPKYYSYAGVGMGIAYHF